MGSSSHFQVDHRVTKVQRWRMWMQQFNYEVRHLSGKLNAEADSMSRIFEHLHLSNLFATAPSTDQADLERRTGVIASSTRLCGNSNSEADFEHCEEGEEEGLDGEGGLDSALFSAHVASCNYSHLHRTAVGILDSNGKRRGLLSEATFDAFRMDDRAEWTMFCNGVTEEEALADAQQATWEESADKDVPMDHATLQVNEAASIYGVGEKLLRSMGWLPDMYLGVGKSSALNLPIDVKMRENCMEGIGYGNINAVHTPTFRENFKKVHNDGAGHIGKIRTYSRLRKLPGFPWGMPTSEVYEKVKNECDGCLTCLKIWSTRGANESASGAVIRQRPWTEVAIDLIVLTEPDMDGNRNILVVIDSFSRAVELFPLKAGDAESVAACLFDVYHRYGRPVRVRCDRAKAFLKSVIYRFQKMMGVALHPTLSYSPQQNGQCERANQEVMRHLRAMVISKPGAQKRWGLLTPAVRRILNNTVHSDTGCTPNELIYGGYGDTETSMFVDELVQEEGEAMAGWLYAKQLEEAQFDILKRSELHQEQKLQTAARKAASGIQRRIEDGVFVLASRGISLGGRPKGKLQSRFTGPYLVVDQVSAMQDHWTYKVLGIEAFRPEGSRRVAGRLRAKSKYEFLVRYDLPESLELGDENPAWQPFANVKHLTALKTFCTLPVVRQQLGETFYVSDDEVEVGD
jgi:hypothetical protein